MSLWTTQRQAAKTYVRPMHFQVSNTYYLPMSKRPLLSHEPRENLITYYQWIPLTLIVQAVLFFIPSLVWRINSARSGLSVNKVNLLLSGKCCSYTCKYIMLSGQLHASQPAHTCTCSWQIQSISYLIHWRKRQGNYVQLTTAEAGLPYGIIW